MKVNFSSNRVRVSACVISLGIGALLPDCLSLDIAELEFFMVERCGAAFELPTCAAICEDYGDAECMHSDECPADAWGLDGGQCYEIDEPGIPLSIECDEPLPIGEYEGFACCCFGENRGK